MSTDTQLLCDLKPASHEINDQNKKEWHAPKSVSEKEHYRGSGNKLGRHIKFYSLFYDNCRCHFSFICHFRVEIESNE